MNFIRTIVKWIMRLCIVGWAATFYLMTLLPSQLDLQPPVFIAPQQVEIAHTPFAYNYKGQTITVVPQAWYLISGLIMSHNDPFNWWRFDLTHDDKSPDTRDLCVVWGNNLRTTDYQKVSVSNDDWMCNFRWGADVSFYPEELSNNHLITNDPAIREQIANLVVGDQITIQGLLVNYSEERWNGRYRNSSLTRTDTGNGACEVIFVQSLKVLHSNNALWSALHRLCEKIFLGILGVRIFLFIFMPSRRAR